MILIKRFINTRDGVPLLLSALPRANINFKRKTNFEDVINDFDQNKTFDQKMKDRLAHSSSKEEKEGAERAMEETLDLLKEELNTESVIRTIKNEILLDETDVLTKAKREQMKALVNETEKHFSNISQEEFLDRAHKLKDAVRLKQDWTPTKDDSIFADYGNYHKFNKSFAKIRDQAPRDLNDDMDPHEGKNVVKFVKTLGSEYAETSQLNDELNNGLDEDKKTHDDVVEGWQDEVNADDNFLYGKPRINFGEKLEDEDSHPKEEGGRMSPWAKEELYDLFLKGWSVRDLSVRFGILPERVKVIVWCKKYYYDEVLPRIDISTVKLGLETELIYGHEHGWQDFGLDMDEIAYRENGVFVGRFTEKAIDTALTKVDQDKMKSLLEKKAKKKHDKITEKFVGEGTKGYFLKEWKVYRGHGSERVNNRFRDIVHQSDKPHLLPEKIRNKLKAGPRVASQGYGIK